MKLTGKAKEQFEHWFSMKYTSGTWMKFTWFNQLPKSMQWGIYQDWADSMGYEMWVEKAIDEFRYWYNIYENDGRPHYNEGFQTRQEARNAAIKAFDEIANRDTRKVKHKK